MNRAEWVNDVRAAARISCIGGGAADPAVYTGGLLRASRPCLTVIDDHIDLDRHTLLTTMRHLASASYLTLSQRRYSDIRYKESPKYIIRYLAAANGPRRR